MTTAQRLRLVLALGAVNLVLAAAALGLGAFGTATDRTRSLGWDRTRLTDPRFDGGGTERDRHSTLQRADTTRPRPSRRSHTPSLRA